jgi:hypothetical protein
MRWALALLGGLATAAVAWPGADDSGTTSRFGFTGAADRYRVPAGVCRIDVEAAGASGGPASTAGTPGHGARVAATVAVVPGQVLLVSVGGAGEAADGVRPGRGGWNGGGDGGAGEQAGAGGGGASDVSSGGRRVLVAAGGGGGGGGGIGGEPGTGGGDGGESDGDAGLAALGVANPATGGNGGTQTAGGAPGANAPDRAITATAGSLGAGGDGAPGGVNGGGGGGGGFYGGGGGGAEFQWTRKPLGAAHGGGGSSFAPTPATYRTGVWGNDGDGWVTITHDPDADRCG